jgi:prepilin-type N-terminal cleavage/methylation domain-containing protein
MRHIAHTNEGFTLIEILVAATIIAILSVIGVVSYTRINMRSRDAKRISDLEQVRSALEMYRTDKGFYPGSSTEFNPLSTDLAVLVSSDPAYMPAIPTDPKSTSTTTIPYYYSPLVPMGTPTRYYGYCICAKLENNSGSGTCTGVTLPSDGCNYGLKNP